MVRVAEGYGGPVIKTIGDEIMSRFASARQAVNAACEMHRALKEDQELAAALAALSERPPTRTGSVPVAGLA